MLRATSLKPQGMFDERPADTIVLDYDARHRRRIALETTHGITFLLDLPDTVVLRSGDALLLGDGRLIEVVAAPEPLVEIRSGNRLSLVRLAWHLGNRHLPVEILANALRIRRDHVIEVMVAQLGGSLREIEAPFAPEGGAYAAAQGAPGDVHHAHRHDHHHKDDHHHDHHDHHHAHEGPETHKKPSAP
jgi:urease accessory protein